jgi:hypothetical protein
LFLGKEFSKAWDVEQIDQISEALGDEAGESLEAD